MGNFNTINNMVLFIKKGFIFTEFDKNFHLYLYIK